MRSRFPPSESTSLPFQITNGLPDGSDLKGYYLELKERFLSFPNVTDPPRHPNLLLLFGKSQARLGFQAMTPISSAWDHRQSWCLKKGAKSIVDSRDLGLQSHMKGIQKTRL